MGIDLGTTYSCAAVFQHGKVALSSKQFVIRAKFLQTMRLFQDRVEFM